MYPRFVYCLSLNFEENEYEIIPHDRESIVVEDGVRFRLTRDCWFLAERGNSLRLSKDLLSLPWRLLDEIGIHVLGDEIRMIEQAVKNFWSEESGDPRSRMPHVIFRVNIECVFTTMTADQHVMGDSEPKMIPTVQTVIDALEKVRVEEKAGECCCICMEEMTPEGEHRMMPCKHVYHEGCILAWLNTSHLCPLCRFALPTP